MKKEYCTCENQNSKDLIKDIKTKTWPLEKNESYIPSTRSRSYEFKNEIKKSSDPKADLIEGYMKKMLETYKMKNSNYGNSFTKTIDEIGLEAGLVPLYNKLHRATSLIKNGNNNFESLDDTLMDLANYALMLRAEIEYRKNKKDE